MNNTRRQHVVSDLHLRQWANEDGQVWALDLNTSKLFCTNTKNICVRRDYHEFEADIELPYSIEEVLAEEIEGPAAKPMLGLADGLLDPLTPEDIDNLCVYFGYLASRTPFTHQKMNKLAIKLHQKNALETLDDPVKLRKFRVEWKKKYPNKDFPTIQKLNEAVTGDSITWKVMNNDHNLSMMMVVGNLMGKEFWKRKWTLIQAPKNRQFICTDNPLVTISGMSSKGIRTETIIPIGPQACLLLEKGFNFNGITIKTANPKVVREINKRLSLHADRNLISASERLLNRMKKVRQSNKKFLKILKEATPGDAPFRQAPFENLSDLLG